VVLFQRMGALDSVAYAEVFNGEIVRFLETKAKQQEGTNKKVSSVRPVPIPSLTAGEQGGTASSIAGSDSETHWARRILLALTRKCQFMTGVTRLVPKVIIHVS
jgi:hypothetical protein